MKYIAILLSSVILMTGCAKINKVVTENEVIAELAVIAATSRVLTNNPQWTDRTVKITGVAISLIEKDKLLDMVDLQSFILNEIQWSTLTAEETAILMTLIDAAIARIEASLEKAGKNPAKELLVAEKVLGWINMTAKMKVDSK
jgi:hypothetical protein